MIQRLGILVGMCAVAIGIFWFFQAKPEPRPVTFFIEYNGTSITPHTALENTSLEEAVRGAGYSISEETWMFPARDTLLAAGTIITVHSAKSFTIEDQNEIVPHTTSALTVREALEQSGVILEGADFVEPRLETALSPSMTLAVTRVTVSEETEETRIPFKKVESEDDTLSFLVKKVTQKGEPGVLTTRYKVSRHNNQVVAKEKIESSVTREPIDEKTVVGTKVTVVKKHTGGASWYAHTGTLSAANPWLPFGSYVRVTNTANGKSVIVKINDRGPFGGGRIIDLDKVAFAKIADLGTGVVNVLMEEIK